MRKLFLISVVWMVTIQSNYSQTNLIGNGSFEYLIPNSLTGDCPTHFTEEYVQCWHQVQGSSDIIPDAYNPFPGIVPVDGQRMAACGALNFTCIPYNEAIMADINIQKDKGYKLGFWLYYAPGSADEQVYMQFTNGLSPATDCNVCDIVPVGDGSQTIMQQTMTYVGYWQYFEFYFTAQINYTQMVFFIYKPDGLGLAAVLIDKVELFEVCNKELDYFEGNMLGSHYYGNYIKVHNAAGVPVLPGLNTHLIAGNYIEILPKFESYIPNSNLNSYFLAEIVPCYPVQGPTCYGGDAIVFDPSPSVERTIVTESGMNISIENNRISATVTTDDLLMICYFLYTVDGRIIHQQNTCNEKTIDLEILSTGMYVLHILLSDGSSKTFKMMVN